MRMQQVPEFFNNRYWYIANRDTFSLKDIDVEGFSVACWQHGGTLLLCSPNPLPMFVPLERNTTKAVASYLGWRVTTGGGAG